MDEKRLREIEARHAQATPGPWIAEDLPYDGLMDPCVVSTAVQNSYGEPMYVAQTVYDMQGVTQEHDVDADSLFIAHSWQDIGDLTAEVRRLSGALLAIANHHPHQVSPPQSLIDAIEACPECKRARETGWPPSRLCNNHYTDMNEKVWAVNQHKHNYHDVELKHIARTALEGTGNPNTRAHEACAVAVREVLASMAKDGEIDALTAGEAEAAIIERFGRVLRGEDGGEQG